MTMTTMMTNRSTFLGFITMVCFACSGSDTSERTVQNQSSSGNTESVFRQIGFDMNAREIKAIEAAKLVRSTSDALFYSTNIGEGGFADITYHLSPTNRRLQKIEFDVFIQNADDARSIYSGLKRQFDQDYNSATTTGYWQGNDGTTDFQVTLKQSVSKTSPGLYAAWEKL